MANPLDYLKDLIPEDTNIFGASPSASTQQLTAMGLLSPEDVEKAKREGEISIDKMPCENHTDLFIQRVLYHDHYYLHNFDTLSRALEKTGFTNIKTVKPGQCQISDIAEELYKAEKDRDRTEVLIEAQKLNDVPKISRYPDNKPNNFIIRTLAEIFNIKITKYNKRRPAFPRLLWFIEKYQKLKQL